jgi:hypothetical protein
VVGKCLSEAEGGCIHLLTFLSWMKLWPKEEHVFSPRNSSDTHKAQLPNAEEEVYRVISSICQLPSDWVTSERFIISVTIIIYI